MPGALGGEAYMMLETEQAHTTNRERIGVVVDNGDVVVE